MRSERTEPLTVQGLIDKLQQMVKEGKAECGQLVFAESGEGTVAPATAIYSGFAYKCGGSKLLFVLATDGKDEAWIHGKKHHGIWVA